MTTQQILSLPGPTSFGLSNSDLATVKVVNSNQLLVAGAAVGKATLLVDTDQGRRRYARNVTDGPVDGFYELCKCLVVWAKATPGLRNELRREAQDNLLRLDTPATVV